jgi:hypothetical protein
MNQKFGCIEVSKNTNSAQKCLPRGLPGLAAVVGRPTVLQERKNACKIQKNYGGNLGGCELLLFCVHTLHKSLKLTSTEFDFFGSLRRGEIDGPTNVAGRNNSDFAWLGWGLVPTDLARAANFISWQRARRIYFVAKQVSMIE